MIIKDRMGREYTDDRKAEKFMAAVYSSAVGRTCLKVLSMPFISKAAGILLNLSITANYAYRFADKHGIDLFDYENKSYTSFNDFFTRKIKPQRRVINPDENTLVCPCDGKVTAYEIAETDFFVVKNSVYDVASLLRDKKLAKKYAGGSAIIVRLTPDDYHRYIYPADGVKSHDRTIKGRLNIVKPIANKYQPVYKENTRTYCMLRTKSFGDIIQLEVGAMLVGKITNHDTQKATVKKGEEKGYFEFGGSTVILLLEKGKAEVCADLLENTRYGIETKLRMGEKIAVKG